MSMRAASSQPHAGASAFVLANAWTRQGEWGGTTLTRALTYTGLQLHLREWTGVKEGYEGFLHCESTTYIGAQQFPRFANQYRDLLEKEERPLAAFTARFDALLVQVADLEERLANDQSDDIVADYVRLHRESQPYSYVFGYGETMLVEQLVRDRLAAAGISGDKQDAGVRAAFTLPGDVEASRVLRDLAASGVPPKTIDLLLLTRRQAHIRTERREAWNRIEEAVRPHVLRQASAIGVPTELAYELTPEELLGIDPAPSTLDIEARVGSTFLAWRGRAHILTGPIHAMVRDHVARGDSARAEGALRGTIGHPGKVRGRVRRVLTPEDQDHFQKGEVLVSDMTTPEMMIACRRAVAIVTDRGGLLCHAAIVAREFGIPCVLGTEHATRSLQDGDLVEVDATTGTVSILERRGA